jgi:hypothetical protein
MLKEFHPCQTVFRKSFHRGIKDFHYDNCKIIEVIPANMLPIEVDKKFEGIAATCIPRNYNSYIVYYNQRWYWPPVQNLFDSYVEVMQDQKLELKKTR